MSWGCALLREIKFTIAFERASSPPGPRDRAGRVEWLKSRLPPHLLDAERQVRRYAEYIARVVMNSPDVDLHIASLIREAVNDTGALYILRELVVMHMDACRPMPAALDGFARGLIWGRHHKGRKGSKTRHRGQSLQFRDDALCRAVEEALAMGAPTLADAFKEVAEATGRDAVSPNHHKVIRRIWTEREAALGGTRDAHL